MKTKSIARFSLLCAMALVLGYFERFIPVAPGIPGVKLGLANTVLLYAVYLMGAKSAMLLMLAKVVLSGFLFAGLSGMLYSLAGGLLSLCVMLLLSRLKDVGIIGVSVGGAVSHNIGQIAVQFPAENKVGIEHGTMLFQVLLVLSAPHTDGGCIRFIQH